MFLYLNGLNLGIEHLDMFWSICDLILWKKLGKKQPSCSGGPKHGEFISGKSNNNSKYIPILEYLIP